MPVKSSSTPSRRVSWINYIIYMVTQRNRQRFSEGELQRMKLYNI